MRNYELTVALYSKVTAAKKKSVVEKINKLIETFKGKVGKTQDWGEKETGNYLFFPLELEGKTVNGLSLKLKADSEIVRYLLVRKD